MICPKCKYESLTEDFHYRYRAIHGFEQWLHGKGRHSCPMCGHEF